MKICSKCNEEKPIEAFYKRADERYYRSYCKDCEKKNYSNFRKSRPHISHLSNAKQRAKKLGLSFDLDKDWFYENLPLECPIFKVKFSDGDFAPSIDRRDSSGGYIKSNCHIISQRANRIKNDATISELEKIIDYLKSFN
jgi:hypothetical protein